MAKNYTLHLILVNKQLTTPTFLKCLSLHYEASKRYTSPCT